MSNNELGLNVGTSMDEFMSRVVEANLRLMSDLDVDERFFEAAYGYNNGLLVKWFKDFDCILALETAADFGHFVSPPCNGRPEYSVYTKTDLDIKGIECILVDTFDGIDFFEECGVRCTTLQQTIIDLLRNDRDDEVIQQCIASYYFSHNETFDGLELPDDVVPMFEDYREDSIHYFDN